MERIDAEAIASVAGNPTDKAVPPAPEGATDALTLCPAGALAVSDLAAALTEAEVAGSTRRCDRGRPEGPTGGPGFGPGLHIADTIARQAGGALGPVSAESGLPATFDSVPG